MSELSAAEVADKYKEKIEAGSSWDDVRPAVAIEIRALILMFLLLKVQQLADQLSPCRSEPHLRVRGGVAAEGVQRQLRVLVGERRCARRGGDRPSVLRSFSQSVWHACSCMHASNV